MSEAARRRIICVPPVVALGSKFDKYKPEEEKDVRKQEVTLDPVLEQLLKAWHRYRMPTAEPDRYYAALMDLHILKKTKYSAKDVERFSLLLGEYQNEANFPEKAGLFLSALINRGKDRTYVIHTRHLTMPPEQLGFMNKKNIIVEGDVGDAVGHVMAGGTITVNGNAGDSVGEGMGPGTITVNGNAGWGIGESMEGGTITVNGDGGDSIGLHMTDGEIYVAGNLGKLDINGIESGKIYHKGKLIVDK